MYMICACKRDLLQNMMCNKMFLKDVKKARKVSKRDVFLLSSLLKLPTKNKVLLIIKTCRWQVKNNAQFHFLVLKFCFFHDVELKILHPCFKDWVCFTNQDLWLFITSFEESLCNSSATNAMNRTAQRRKLHSQRARQYF